MEIKDRNDDEISIEVLEVKQYKGVEVEIVNKDEKTKMKVYLSLDNTALLIENLKCAMQDVVKLF